MNVLEKIMKILKSKEKSIYVTKEHQHHQC